MNICVTIDVATFNLYFGPEYVSLNDLLLDENEEDYITHEDGLFITLQL